MLYTCVQDFFEKTAGQPRLSRAEERALALRMAQGDAAARHQLQGGYLPMVAGHLRHCAPHLQTLRHLYLCLQALDNAMDAFDFLQDSEPFSHRLSWHLRQATVRCIADRREKSNT